MLQVHASQSQARAWPIRLCRKVDGVFLALPAYRHKKYQKYFR